MSYPTPRRHARALARIAVAVACTGLMAFAGLPVLTGSTEAAPKAKRCDQMYGITGDPAQPGTLPPDGTITKLVYVEVTRSPSDRPQASWVYLFDG